MNESGTGENLNVRLRPTNEPSSRFAEVARLFLLLGIVGFGGPAAHVALMRREVVERRSWLEADRFARMFAACNLIPGPSSTELAMFLGYRRAGWIAMLLAGGLFILPAMTIMLAIAWTYQHFESTHTMAAALYGIRAVIVGVMLWALVDFGRKAVRRVEMMIVATAVTVLTVAGVSPILLLLAGGLALALMAGLQSVPLLAPVGALAFPMPGRVPLIFLTFLKIGATTFGSGYVLFAFLHADVVGTFHWLTERQLFDAVAIGQATPGPLFTTATFIGYLAGGLPGAIAATVAIFLPGFLLVPFLDRIVTEVERHRTLRLFLDGVTSAVVGLIAGVVLAVGRIAVVDLPTTLIALVTFLVLLRYPLVSPVLVIAGAVAGMLLRGTL